MCLKQESEDVKTASNCGVLIFWCGPVVTLDIAHGISKGLRMAPHSLGPGQHNSEKTSLTTLSSI